MSKKITDLCGAARGALAMEYIAAKVDRPRFEVLQLCFLFRVAGHGPKGATMTTLMEEMDLPHSFVSRNCKLFSGQTMAEPWVEVRIDYENPKYRLVSLTEAGRSALMNHSLICCGDAMLNRDTNEVTWTASGKRLAKQYKAEWEAMK